MQYKHNKASKSSNHPDARQQHNAGGHEEVVFSEIEYINLNTFVDWNHNQSGLRQLVVQH